MLSQLISRVFGPTSTSHTERLLKDQLDSPSSVLQPTPQDSNLMSLTLLSLNLSSKSEESNSTTRDSMDKSQVSCSESTTEPSSTPWNNSMLKLPLYLIPQELLLKSPTTRLIPLLKLSLQMLVHKPTNKSEELIKPLLKNTQSLVGGSGTAHSQLNSIFYSDYQATIRTLIP